MDTVPDLFVAPGPVGTPIGLIEPGLSSSLRVNSAYVLAAGGDPFRLRDGVDYSANPTGEAGFSGLVDSFVTAFDTPRAFDATARAGEELGLIGFAANSVGWLEAGRSAANLAAENKNAAYFRTTEALSNATGVNLDEELSLLLQLEQSYQASSRLIKAVDDMLNSLLNAVR
jgi:flagellar hook-associated protein 1